MVYSPTNYPKSFPHAGKTPHLVTNEIDAGAIKLQPPKIRPINSRAGKRTTSDTVRKPRTRTETQSKAQGAVTHWETPFNRPAFDQPENIQYTRLASQYLQQGRIEDAERLYNQALIVAERTFKEGDPAIFRAMEDLAGFYYRHEKYKQAEPLVARILKQRVDKLSPDDWLLIRTVDQLADIYEKCGEPLQAQALYKLLLARQEEATGRRSPVCAFTLSRLADNYLRHEHYLPAESLMLTILEIQETNHGRYSIEISTTLQELSKIYQKLGRYDKSAEMLERLLHVLESIHGDNGLSVASCLLKLADLLTEVDMTREAEPLYRRAQEIYTLSYGNRTAAHSVFKKKLERVTGSMSRLSKDKPVEQEECSRFPAINLTFDEMPLNLDNGHRCDGHGVVSDALQCRQNQSIEELVRELIANDVLPADICIEPTPPAVLAPPVVAEKKPVAKPQTRTNSKTLTIELQHFAPDPSGCLDSILDPLFVSELAERYEKVAATMEFARPELEDLNFAPEKSDFDETAEIIQFNQQRVTLALPVPGLITLSKTDIPRHEPLKVDNVTPLSQRDTVQERAITPVSRPRFMPEPFPSSRKKGSRTQALFPVKL